MTTADLHCPNCGSIGPHEVLDSSTSGKVLIIRCASRGDMVSVRLAHKRVTDRSALGRELAKLYRSGQSIRRLASEQGLAYGTAHRLLVEAGVTLRERGGDMRGGKS